MCLTKELLLRFYSSMDYTLRFLIHFKSMTTLGYPFDKILAEEPWRTYEALVRLMGQHNADVIITLLSNWLRRNGCYLDPEALRRYLSDRGAWPIDGRPS